MNAPSQERQLVIPNQDSQAAVDLKLSYRADLARRAASRLPMTAEGLPVGFYRVDLLPATREELQGSSEADALRIAYQDLSYEFGYPTLQDGRPFWHKLEFEASLAYGCFQVYLDRQDEGPRELTQLALNGELMDIFRRRNEAEGGTNTWTFEQTLQTLQEFSALHYWRYRAKAYDVYKEAAYRHIRLRRQSSTEDEHFQLAKTLMTKLQDQVLNKPDFFKEMAPKVAVDLLHKLVAIQRISTGLPATGPLANKEAPEDTSFEMILRSLSQRAGQELGGTMYDQSGEVVEGGKGILARVLEDRDNVTLMQEMVVRVTRATQSSQDARNASNTHRKFKGRNLSGRGPISSEDTLPYDVSGAPGENVGDGNE